MIIKLGKCYICRFGLGDILLQSGLTDDPYGAMLLSNLRRPHPIGRLENTDSITDEEMEPDIILEFSSIESIDITIHHLETIKRQMKNLKKQEETT